jgi:hypothetical protein
VIGDADVLWRSFGEDDGVDDVDGECVLRLFPNASTLYTRASNLLIFSGICG